MNKKRISLITVGALVLAPTTGLTTLLVTSCANGGGGDSRGIAVSTKQVEINHDNGIGTFDVILDEQPADNAAYVYIITAEGPHHVELLDPNASIQTGHPAVLYAVNNGIAKVFISFTDFVGVTTNTVVGIEVRYNSRNGDWVKKSVNGINVFTQYVQNNKEEIHLISLNDFHGAAAGYGEPKDEFPGTNVKNPGAIRLMNKISPIIENHPGSLLVTAGDNNSGNMYSTAVHGESMYKTLQAMGARYSAVGNHAFEWGISPMATYQFDNWARTSQTVGNYFVASNILNGKLDAKKEWESDPTKDGFEQDYAFWESQRVKWADPWKIVNMNGHPICLVGLTTDATLEDGNKSVTDNLSFIDYNAALNYSVYNCQHTVSQQLFDSIESFILLTHVESGTDAEGQPTGAAVKLAKELTVDKVDAIISAHSHDIVNAKVYNANTGKNIYVGQASTEGRAYLDLVFTFDNTITEGSRLQNVSMNIENTALDDTWSWAKAESDMADNRANPKTEVVKNVIDVFDKQKSKVFDALAEQLSVRTDTLLHPAVNVGGKGIGHEYFMNDEYWDEQRPLAERDGGYINDQLGAWSSYAQLVGFASTYYEDIVKSSAGLTFPAISFFTIDSMKIEYADDPDSPVPVTMKDMYDLQTYENSMVFGYLSIWQLANIINHSLSGRDESGQNNYFNYDSPKINYYWPDKTTNKTNDLSTYYLDTAGTEHKECCPAKKFDFATGYKKMTDPTYCLYPCGPIQWYGFQVGLKQVTGQSDRVYVLDTVPITSDEVKEALGVTHLPDIKILDNHTKELKDDKTLDKVYRDIRDVDEWLSMEKYYIKYGEYIPTVLSSFLWNGANWQFPMFKTYMEYNEDLDWKNYPVQKFSQLSRDMLVAFARMYKTQYQDVFPFDLPLSLLRRFVIYNE